MLTAQADLFESVIVPRSLGWRWRVSAVLGRSTWRFWHGLALRIRDAERREDTLAVFAPLLMVTLLAYWIAAQIAGYGLLFWALRWGLNPHPASLLAAIYFAGTSVLTTGYGDVVPTEWLTRMLSLLCGASGLATLGIVATFLFQTFAAFQRREAFIVAISERTGAPPSGLEFVMQHVQLELVDDIGPVLRDAQAWIADLMETHLAYGVLTYFRSSHDDESWVGTLGALLDAATLLLTTVDIGQRGQAELTARLGGHLVRDFTRYFHLQTGDAAGVERDEFVTAYERLRELGTPLRPLDEAWPAFTARRATYAVALDAMARWWRIPPARWIGDRSRVRGHGTAVHRTM